MGRNVRSAATTPRDPADVALDEALLHIRDLAGQLRGVLVLHRPHRQLLRGRRCTGCSRPYPCPTVGQLRPGTH